MKHVLCIVALLAFGIAESNSQTVNIDEIGIE